MIYINEWLPNPFGPDAGSEFIELFNNGSTTVRLDGWTLATESRKKFSLSGRSIAPGGYLVLKHGDTRLSLKNTDGGLSLYGSSGAVVDVASFSGSAPEGKSFGRVFYGDGHAAGAGAQSFAWSDPTPNAANKAAEGVAIAENNFTYGAALSPPLGAAAWMGLLLLAASVILLIILYAIKKSEHLSQLFFGGNEKARA